MKTKLGFAKTVLHKSVTSIAWNALRNPSAANVMMDSIFKRTTIILPYVQNAPPSSTIAINATPKTALFVMKITS